MPVTSDSNQYGVAVTVRFNEQALAPCVNPAVLEALRNANWYADIPNSSTSSGVDVSDQQYNLIRLDGNGALYAPAARVVTLLSQTVSFPATIGPGVPVDISFSVGGDVSDFALAFPDVFFDIQPYGSLIHARARRFGSGQLTYSFYRDLDVDMSTVEDAVIQATGKVLIIPSPSA